MFDFGISELMIIGAVGLVVLGPERLPVVARTAGEWIGKAQRLVSQVRNDIERESELSELKKIKEEAEKVATEVKDSVNQQATELEEQFDSVKRDFGDTRKEIEDSVVELSSSDEVVYDDDSPYDFMHEDYQPGKSTQSEPAGKKFEKRERAEPTVAELVKEVERLRAEIGMQGRMPSHRGRMVCRSRSNRVRIWR